MKDPEVQQLNLHEVMESWPQQIPFLNFFGYYSKWQNDNWTRIQLKFQSSAGIQSQRLQSLSQGIVWLLKLH